MDTEEAVAQHYTHGSLEQTILDALTQSGKDPDKLAPADLAPVDELHIGGLQATAEVASGMKAATGQHLLDVGCGIGGPARFFAQERGCRVTGIDLTEDYVRVANALSKRVGLNDRASFRRGSALDLPFAGKSFDGAYMLHVGMNIQDKARLFSEVRRVLKPNAAFAVYDAMRDAGEGELGFPVPWASRPDHSFVESAAAYARLLEAAGFTIEKTRNRRDAALEFFHGMRANAAAGPAPLGPHIVLGASTPQMFASVVDGLERGLVAPVEIIARAV
jgi:SAM-dependent methyltransferase